MRFLVATVLLSFASACFAYTHNHLPSHTNGWNAHFGYQIPTKGEYMVQLMGKACKPSSLGLVILNSQSGITGDLENTARDYFNHTYGQGFLCTPNSWAGEVAGTTPQYCPRKIMQQDYAARPKESDYKYEVVALTSDTDTSLTTVPFFQIQFNSSSDEECAASVTGLTGQDAHAGHNHRRNGMRRAAAKFNLVIEFPEKMPDGFTDVTYPSKWYFFSDANLTFFNMDVMREDPFLEIEQISHEVFADPGECAVASSTSMTSTTCACDSDSSCEDDKYMWSGIIFGVGLIGLVPIFWQACATNKKMMQILSLLNTFGGGALLAVAVAHVFPEAIDLYPASDSGDYPLAAILCALGYWGMLFLDKVLVLFCVPEHHAPEAEAEPNPNPVDAQSVDVELDAPGSGKIDEGSAPGSGKGHGAAAGANGHVHGAAGANGHGHGGKDEDIHSCAADVLLNTDSNMLQAVGVFLAMAVHSVMAGFALGLKCEKSSMENLAIAIVCHKMFDVSALGIVLVRANVALWKSIPLCLVVALMTPIGVWCAVAGGDVDRNTNGALQAICAGTFLYVSIQEVLAYEYAKNDGKCMMSLRALTTLLGIGMIALASIAHTRGGHTH